MDVGLFRLPWAVLLRGGGVFRGIGGQRNAVLNRPAAGPVGPVAVFAVHVVGDDHVGLILADHLRHVAQQLVLAPDAQAFFQAGAPFILEFLAGQFGIHPDAAVPQPVQRLHQAKAAHPRHVHHHHFFAQLGVVVGDHAAHVQQFVVRVGHQHHHVRLALEGPPGLHPVGQVPRRHHLQLDDAVAHLLFHRPHPEVGQRLLKGDVLGEVLCQMGLHGQPFALALPCPLDHHVHWGHAPAQDHPRRGGILRGLHLHVGVLFRLVPHGHVALVQHFFLVLAVGGHADGAAVGNVPAFLGRGGGQAQQRQQRGADDP